MFQEFEATTRPEQGPPRLAALRETLASNALNGFLIPRADIYQGEYVAACDERLAWLTGFTGSAGFCAALMDRAAMFADGRYRLQARAQIAPEFEVVAWPQTGLADWLIDALVQGGTVGFDPWLHTAEEINSLRAALSEKGITLQSCVNLIDQIWTDRPEPPNGQAEIYPDDQAGKTATEKLAEIARSLAKTNAQATVITQPDSICWLLNIRGSDIPRNPVFQCCATLTSDAQLTLFVDAERTENLRDYFGKQINFAPKETLLETLDTLKGPVLIDKRTIPVMIAERLGKKGIWGLDPCALPKATKTPPELAGSRTAHLRDAAAMIEFLTEFSAAEANYLTEIDIVTKLEAYRRRDPHLRDISFDTICGSGANGAVIHYRVDEHTNRIIQEGELIVLDSGGQYVDGTTDITRTLVKGTPSDDARRAYTLVLKGVIAMSQLSWPKGRSGRELEAIGRAPLWQAGLDFDHGLGHGVGVFLSVHEGPQALSRLNPIPLEPGMILSIEPGYYREGAFGVRLENLAIVAQAEPISGGDADRHFLCWETLTFVPFERNLIDASLLSHDERRWLNLYHQSCVEKLRPGLSAAAQEWLDAACQAI